MLVVVCQFSPDVIGYLLKKWLPGSNLSVKKKTKVVSIYMGKPVGPQFGQMVRKIQD